jgi:hypothetical protein
MLKMAVPKMTRDKMIIPIKREDTKVCAGIAASPERADINIVMDVSKKVAKKEECDSTMRVVKIEGRCQDCSRMYWSKG